MPVLVGKRGKGRNRAKKTTTTRGTQTMKKVSKKGAYSRQVKDQMVKRRAPMVETKQRVHSDIATINGYPAGNTIPVNAVNPLNWRILLTDDAFTNIPLRSWQRNTQGFNDFNVIGNSIFSKYLNMKIQLRFPRGEGVALPDSEAPGTTYSIPNKMIQNPTKVYLICGWITESMNYPLLDVNTPSLPAQSAAGYEAINTYITQQLKPFFDDDEDKLQFRPKATTNIKIDKYVKFTPNLNGSVATQAVPYHTSQPPGELGPVVGYQAQGSIPDVHRSHSWKTNRKIALTEGTETSFPVDKQNLYPNNSWIPFAVIYNPDYESQVAQSLIDPTNPKRFSQVQFMEYRWNDAHYFTDS